MPALSLKGFRLLRFFCFYPRLSNLLLLRLGAKALKAAFAVLGLLRYISIA
jgi:Zn-dependent protease